MFLADNFDVDEGTNVMTDLLSETLRYEHKNLSFFRIRNEDI